MFRLFFKKSQNLKDDVLSGLTVALALVPEAVAFAFVAGVDPLVGLYAAFFMGFITAAFGGRPGMISGATGAMAVVMTPFVVQYGVGALFAAVITAGIFQVIAGFVGVGRFLKLLPHPVMLGFVNGLAIVIGLAQFHQFKTGHALGFSAEEMSFHVDAHWMSPGSPEAMLMAAMVLGTMAIIHFLPRISRALPAPLVAILLCTLIAQVAPVDGPTVADVVNSQRVLAAQKSAAQEEFKAVKEDVALGEMPAVAGSIINKVEQNIGSEDVQKGLQASLPSFGIPDINPDWEMFMGILILGLTLASIGLIESLMTLSLIDEITETRGNANRECYAQGAANIVSGFFGAMGGCAMIGQSMININSGGRGRTSGIAASLFLLAFILFAPGLIEMIPVAALIGVMFMVVIATFEWSSLRLIGKIPTSDVIVIALVSIVTVISDLAVAVGIGVIASSICYAWACSERLTVSSDKDDKTGEKVYKLNGELFFGSSTSFKSFFDPKGDPEVVSLDLSNAKICDHSGLEALHSLNSKYSAQGKKLQLVNVNDDCGDLLSKASKVVHVDLKSRNLAA